MIPLDSAEGGRPLPRSASREKPSLRQATQPSVAHPDKRPFERRRASSIPRSSIVIREHFEFARDAVVSRTAFADYQRGSGGALSMKSGPPRFFQTIGHGSGNKIAGYLGFRAGMGGRQRRRGRARHFMEDFEHENSFAAWQWRPSLKKSLKTIGCRVWGLI